LQLDSSWSFSGTVAGFGAKNGSTGGELKVDDGIHTANIALFGNYMASSLVTASDGHGGTLITEAPLSANQQPLLTTSHA
jgi:hypothetical protein